MQFHDFQMKRSYTQLSIQTAPHAHMEDAALVCKQFIRTDLIILYPV